MAAYQYYLEVLPEDGIIKKLGLKPDSIAVSTETGYFKSEAEIYWNESDMVLDEIVPKIDGLVKREKWSDGITSFNWKTYTETLDNDAVIYLNEDTLKIKVFSFRADLREDNLKFLLKMIELGKEYKWMFMDRTGKLMKPDLEEIKVSVKDSNAYAFLQDPILFLENLDKQG